MVLQRQHNENAKGLEDSAALVQVSRSSAPESLVKSFLFAGLVFSFLVSFAPTTTQADESARLEAVGAIDGELYYNEPVPATMVDPIGTPTTGFSHQPILREPWEWHILPEGLIYRPYMAGVHESRISGVFYQDQDHTRLFDVALGGQVPILRFGSFDPVRPQGWQLDLEGAAFPRLNLDQDWDVESTDFRVGVPLTLGLGDWQAKLAYYHLSSHLGDEFILRNPGSETMRINFSRDVFVLGLSHFPHPAIRVYGEAGWAFRHVGGSAPWEFQFGVDLAPPGPTGLCGVPFLAINAHLREEHNFGGNLVVQAGWLWRGETDRALRVGLHYYNGKSSQFQFFDQFEEQIGLGLWYDY